MLGRSKEGRTEINRQAQMKTWPASASSTRRMQIDYLAFFMYSVQGILIDRLPGLLELGPLICFSQGITLVPFRIFCSGNSERWIASLTPLICSPNGEGAIAG